MIFAAGAEGPTVVLMLSEADIVGMRLGQTRFVDERQTGGIEFRRIVLSLSKTDADSLELLKSAGHDTTNYKVPEPHEGKEGRCQGCDGIIPLGGLFEDRCIVCWATEAKRARTESN